MPPKRRTSAITPKAGQSTLAFHGASNKVTKPGARAQGAKKTLVASSLLKDTDPDITEIVSTDEELTTADAAIVHQAEQAASAPQVSSTPEEERAKKISDARIKKYWADKEKQRKSRRVHQEDITTHEKILREFDMSGRYGPCTGIARLKRWKRAHRLELDPPIEVLAVLLKEMESKDKLTVQRSRVDELLNARVDVEEV
ncbi:DNA polymerase delta, subunit 4-domain-containing protein [Massariosphaeria phaeospora]|uniref:DNA polymerase delta, subunit 4-domain-containing protein n=1 Tax=Massariosphaeria phaeospora TaxID=100035 RepID=A0A7C8MEM2_9PLEO|nr:DNA polymerase delta, subunit 4-domain-containing protein [Massariosphaeria phaeospora]